MKKWSRLQEKYDLVILDPPAFTKSRSSVKNAVKGYREINLRGMKLVKDGGYLVDAGEWAEEKAPIGCVFCLENEEK